MKRIYQYLLIITAISFVFFACGSPRSRTVVIVHQNDKFFTVGEPHVNYNTNGASLDYFIPGAIIVFKTDRSLLNTNCKEGKVYQINKDNLMIEIGTFDTALNDTIIANKYLISEIE